MNRNKNPQNRSSILNLGQYKLSALVFASVLLVGTGIAVIKQFTGTDAKLAKVLEAEVPVVQEIPSWWYSEHFGASVCEREVCKDDTDPDADKLSNSQEYFYGSNPNKRDTNDNGLSDGEDVAFGYAPNKPGKTTFEEASSDQNVFGESLVYNQDIKDLIVDMTDLNKVLLPEISDAELTIIPNSNKDTFTDYMLALDNVSRKYNKASNQVENIESAIKQKNQAEIDRLVYMSKSIAEEYRQIPVPQDAVTLHKYHISLWRNLPTVLDTPEIDPAAGMNNPALSKWYDGVQIMMSLNQKVAIELQKLRVKHE